MNLTRNLFSDKDPTPNKLTIAMGELIKQAREAAGFSQSELAKLIYRRQATLSALELGKSESTISTLLYLSVALKKPISYFFPRFAKDQIEEEQLTANELELIQSFRKIWNNELQQVAIKLMISLADFDPTQTLRNALDLAKDNQQLDKDLKDFLKRKGGK